CASHRVAALRSTGSRYGAPDTMVCRSRSGESGRTCPAWSSWRWCYLHDPEPVAWAVLRLVVPLPRRRYRVREAVAGADRTRRSAHAPRAGGAMDLPVPGLYLRRGEQLHPMSAQHLVDFYYAIGSRYSYSLRLRSRSSNVKRGPGSAGIRSTAP